MQSLPSRKFRGDHPIRVEMLPLSSIKENPNNAREHNRNQLTKLKRSIEKFGFNVPILVDEEGELLCGHGLHPIGLWQDPAQTRQGSSGPRRLEALLGLRTKPGGCAPSPLRTAARHGEQGER
jgi:hypothetical protein